MLDIALEEAEEKEKRQITHLPFPTVRFVPGGMNRNGMMINELGEQPTLITSKATNTDEGEEGYSLPVVVEPRKRCEIPFDYTRINRMQLERYLTRSNVFDMTRLTCPKTGGRTTKNKQSPQSRLNSERWAFRRMRIRSGDILRVLQIPRYGNRTNG